MLTEGGQRLRRYSVLAQVLLPLAQNGLTRRSHEPWSSHLIQPLCPTLPRPPRRHLHRRHAHATGGSGIVPTRKTRQKGSGRLDRCRSRQMLTSDLVLL